MPLTTLCNNRGAVESGGVGVRSDRGAEGGDFQLQKKVIFSDTPILLTVQN